MLSRNFRKILGFSALIAGIFVFVLSCENPFVAGLGKKVDINPPVINWYTPEMEEFIRIKRIPFLVNVTDDISVASVRIGFWRPIDEEPLSARDADYEKLLIMENTMDVADLPSNIERNKDVWVYFYDVSEAPLTGEDGELLVKIVARDGQKKSDAKKMTYNVKNNPPAISLSYPYIEKEFWNKIPASGDSYSWPGGTPIVRTREFIRGLVTDAQGIRPATPEIKFWNPNKGETEDSPGVKWVKMDEYTGVPSGEGPEWKDSPMTYERYQRIKTIGFEYQLFERDPVTGQPIETAPLLPDTQAYRFRIRAWDSGTLVTGDGPSRIENPMESIFPPMDKPAAELAIRKDAVVPTIELFYNSVYNSSFAVPVDPSYDIHIKPPYPYGQDGPLGQKYARNPFVIEARVKYADIIEQAVIEVTNNGTSQKSTLTLDHTVNPKSQGLNAPYNANPPANEYLFLSAPIGSGAPATHIFAEGEYTFTFKALVRDGDPNNSDDWFTSSVLVRIAEIAPTVTITNVTNNTSNIYTTNLIPVGIDKYLVKGPFTVNWTAVSDFIGFNAGEKKYKVFTKTEYDVLTVSQRTDFEGIFNNEYGAATAHEGPISLNTDTYVTPGTNANHNDTQFYIYIVARDKAGNVGGAYCAIIVDQGNPVIRGITYPINTGEYYLTPSTFTIEGSMRDRGGDATRNIGLNEISNVYWTLTNNKTTPAFSDPDNPSSVWRRGAVEDEAKWSARVTRENITSMVGEGRIWLHVVARDKAGNLSTTTTTDDRNINNWAGTNGINESNIVADVGKVDIYIDNADPVIAVNVTGVTQNGASNYTKSDFDITITAGDTFALRTIEVKRNGTVVPPSGSYNTALVPNVELPDGTLKSSLSNPVNAVVHTNFTEIISQNTAGSPLADDTYTYTITVTDFVGRETVANYTVIVDTKPPVIGTVRTTDPYITTSSFTATGTVRDQVTASPVTNVYWKLSDKSSITGASGVYTDEAAYLADVENWTSVSYGGLADWTAPINGIDALLPPGTEGSVYLYVAAKDAAGNISNPVAGNTESAGNWPNPGSWIAGNPQIGKMPVYIDQNPPEVVWDKNWNPGDSIPASGSSQLDLNAMSTTPGSVNDPFINTVKKHTGETNYYAKGDFTINFTAVDSFALRSVVVTRSLNGIVSPVPLTGSPSTGTPQVTLHTTGGLHSTSYSTPYEGGTSVSNPAGGVSIIAAQIVLPQNGLSDGMYTYRITVTDFVTKSLRVNQEFTVIVDKTLPIVTISDTRAAIVDDVNKVDGDSLYIVNGVFDFKATSSDGNGVETKWWLLSRTNPATDTLPVWDDSTTVNGTTAGGRAVYAGGTGTISLGAPATNTQIDTLRGSAPAIPDLSEYTLYIMAQDKAGNERLVTRYIKVDQDTDKPSITDLSPAQGSFISVATLTGTLKDDDNVGSYTVEYYNGSTWVYVTANGASGVTATPLAREHRFTLNIPATVLGDDGIKTLRITAYDDRTPPSQLGDDVNVSRRQNRVETLTFTWDQTPPETVWDRGWTPTISGGAITNNPGNTQLNLDEMSLLTDSSRNPITTITGTVKKLNNEINYYTNGNFTINFAAMDGIALGTVEVTRRDNSGNFGTTNLLTTVAAATVTVYDSQGSTPETGAYNSLLTGGSLSVPGTKNIVAAKIVLPQNGLGAGTYTYRITVTDFVGQRKQYQDFTIIVDTVPPDVEFTNTRAAKVDELTIGSQPLYTVNGVFNFEAAASDNYGVEGSKWWLLAGKRSTVSGSNPPKWLDTDTLTSITYDSVTNDFTTAGHTVYASGTGSERLLNPDTQIDTLPPSTIPDTSHYTLFVIARDKAGNEKTVKRYIYVDQATDNPSITDLSPSDGEFFTTGAITLRGAVNDDDGIASVKIEYYNSGWQTLREETWSASWPKNYNLTQSLANTYFEDEGPKQVRITVTDANGSKLGLDVSQSDRPAKVVPYTINFTRDSQPPAIPVLAEAIVREPMTLNSTIVEAYGLGIMDTSDVTNPDQKPSFKWTISRGTGGDLVGYIIPADPVGDTYNWTWTIPANCFVSTHADFLPDGYYTVRFDAVDIAGNSGSRQWSFTKDTTAPDITFNNINPVENDTGVLGTTQLAINGVTRITDAENFKIKVTVSDAYSSIGAQLDNTEYYFEYRIYKWENRFTQTTWEKVHLTNNPGKSETRDIPLTGSGINGDGVYWMDVRVKDRLGNGTSGTPSDTTGGIVTGVVFILDSKAPEVVWDRSWTPGSSIPSSGSDELDLDKMSLPATVSTKNPITISNNGTVRKPVDENFFTKSVFTINFAAVDTFALGTVEVTQRDSGGGFGANLLTGVQVTVHDSQGGSQTGMYNSLLTNGSLSVPGTTNIVAAMIALPQPQTLTPGSYTYRVTVTDFVGQRKQYQDFTIIVDTVDPNVEFTDTRAAKVEELTIGSQPLYTVNGVFNFAAAATDTYGVDGSKWWLLSGKRSTVSGSNPPKWLDTDTLTSITYDSVEGDFTAAGHTVYASGGGTGFNNLQDPQTQIDTLRTSPSIIPDTNHYTLFVIARDKAGNEKQIKRYIYVNQATDVPAITGLSPSDGEFFTTDDITLRGTVTDDDGIESIKIDYNGVSTTIASWTASPWPKNYSLEQSLKDIPYFDSEGPKQIIVTVTDANGSKLGLDQSQTDRPAKVVPYTINFTRDKTPPAITVPAAAIIRAPMPLTGTIVEAYGLGIMDTSNVTNPQQKPSFKWTIARSSPDADLEGYIIPADPTGSTYNWTWTIPANCFVSGADFLPDGFHTVRFDAVDKAGNSRSTQWSFTKDTQGPDISFNPPLGAKVYGRMVSGNIVISGNTSQEIADNTAIVNANGFKDVQIRISGRFTDEYSAIYKAAGGEPGNVSYEYRIDGIPSTTNTMINAGWNPINNYHMFSDTSNSKSQDWRIDMPDNTRDGKYLLSIRVKDSLGNGENQTSNPYNSSTPGNGGYGFETNMVFSVDRAIPRFDRISTVDQFQNNNFPITGYIRNTTAVKKLSVSLDGTVVAAIGTEVSPTVGTIALTAVTYDFEEGDGPESAFSFTVTIPTAGLTENSHAIMMTVVGASDQSAMEPRNFTYDKTPPDVAFNAPTVGELKASGTLSNNGKYIIRSSNDWVTGQPRISGTTEDRLSGVDTIQYFIGRLNDDTAANDAARETLYNGAAWVDTELHETNPAQFWSGSLYYWTFSRELNGFESSPGAYEKSGPFVDTIPGNMRAFYLPLYVKVTDRAKNVTILQYKLWVDPDRDIPRVTINPPPENDALVGGEVRIQGIAEDNIWIREVEIRIRKYTGPTTYEYYRNSPADNWIYGNPTTAPDAQKGWVLANIQGELGDRVNWNYTLNTNGDLNPTGEGYRQVAIEVRALDAIVPEGTALYLVGSAVPWSLRFDAGVPRISVPDISRIKNDNTYENPQTYAEGMRVQRKFQIKTYASDEGGISRIMARLTGESSYTQIVTNGEVNTAALKPGWTVNPPPTATFDSNSARGWRYYIVNPGNVNWAAIDLNPDGKTYSAGTMIQLVYGVTINGTGTAIKANSGTQVLSGDNSVQAQPKWDSQRFEYELIFDIDSLTQYPWGKTGNYTLDLQVYDNNQNPSPYTTSGRYTLGVDNYYPTLVSTTQYNAVTSRHYVSGTASDFYDNNNSNSGSLQGLERVLVYFERSGVYYNAKNVANTGMTTRENVKNGGTAWDAAPQNAVFNNFPVLNPVDKGTILGTVWESPHAMVIDKSELGDDTDTDIDGTFAEMWDGRVEKIWQARLDTTLFGDGPITVHYIIMDTAGNATHYTEEIYIGNKKPLIRSINLGTNIGNNTLTWRPNPITVGDTVEGNSEIQTNFRVRNNRLGLNLEALYGNGAKHYRISYVTRNPAAVNSTAMTRGTVYTIATAGNTNWTRYGAPNNFVGTTFVATSGARPTNDSGDATTGTAYAYTYPGSAGTVVTGDFDAGDYTLDPTEVDAVKNPTGRVDFVNGIEFTTFTNMPDTAGKTYDAYGNMNLLHDKRFIIKVYDTTVSGGTEAQQLAHVALINVDFDNTDGRAPFIALADFGKEYISGGGDYPVLANNADRTERALPDAEYTKNVVTTAAGIKKGYVQYAADSTPNTTANVSGMVIFKGKAADNNRIQRITAAISNYIPGNGITTPGAAFDIATWSTATNKLEPATNTNTIISMQTADNARGFEEENPSLTLDYSHVVNWNFAWDTSTVTGIARENVTVTFTVYDANGNNTPVSTTVNIVPYIAEVITPLTAANSANPSAFNRSALGWYPVREDDYIHIRGFNFNGGSTGVQVNETTLNGIAAATAGANVGGITVPAGVRTSTYITARIDSNGTAGDATNVITSGPLVLTVNSITSFNNRNNDTPAYNKEPNNLNNNTLNDDRRLYVWNTGLLVNSSNIQNPIMRMDNNANRYTTFGTFIGSGTGSAQLKLILNNTGLNATTNAPQTGTTAALGTVLYNNNRFLNTGIGVTPDGDWAVAASSMSSAGSPFTFVYDNLGIGTTAWTTSNANEVRRLMVGLGNDSNRIKFPRIAMQRTNGAPTSSTNPVRAVLAYYDGRNADDADYPVSLNYGYFYNADDGERSEGYVSGYSNFDGVTVSNSNYLLETIPNSSYYVATATSAKAKSGQYVAAGLLRNGRAVVAWYDSTNQCLWLSYGNSAPGGTNIAIPGQNTAQWQANAVNIKDYAGTHVEMAVDAADGVHLAYVDARNSGLWYTYIPPTGNGGAGDTSVEPNVNNRQTIRVDTYLSAGTKLMLNVRTENGRYVPYITYIHNAFAETKNSVRVAWRKDFTIDPPDPNDLDARGMRHGTNPNHTFTGAWEVMTVPAGNVAETSEIVSNGVPTGNTFTAPNGSTLRAPTAGINNTILVGYMTNRWYEGAILKYNIITSPQ